jgi:uncharacterized membrane protein YhhN
LGRPQPIYTFTGKAYSMDAVLITSLVTIAIVLLLVRRWRMPFGAITALLTLNAVALATQSDTYWDIPAAVVAGIVADILLAALKERARGGNAFYAFAFVVPFVLSAGYIVSVRLHDGALGWPPNMIVGAPFIAGIVGLLVSFCFAPPLGVRVVAPESEPGHLPVYEETSAARVHAT